MIAIILSVLCVAAVPIVILLRRRQKCVSAVRVAIQGAIGAGKTTLLTQLAKFPGVLVVTEPVSLWLSDHGENMLEGQYLDPQANAPLFQIYSMTTRIDECHNAADNHIGPIKVIFTDRSPEADRIFFDVNNEKYGFSKYARDVYNRLYARYMARIKPPTGLVFLNTSKNK